MLTNTNQNVNKPNAKHTCAMQAVSPPKSTVRISESYFYLFIYQNFSANFWVQNCRCKFFLTFI